MAFCALAVAAGSPGRAHAHLGSTKYVDVTPTAGGARLIVALDVDDAGLALGLGLSPSEEALRSREDLLAGWITSGLSIASDGRACEAHARGIALSVRDGRAFVEVPFDATCASASEALVLRDETVFDDDPDHRAFVTIHDPHGARATVLSASAREVRIEREERASAWATIVTFVGEGAWHLVTGLDHVLFVLTLLLGGAWRARSARTAFGEAAWLVTAFTVGHSVSLCASALGWIALPSGPVEVAIAASVVIAAGMNLVPSKPAGRGLARPLVALGFGALHGLGFASVLGDVGLPASQRVIALLSFNVGIELAQIALVALVLPILAACAKGSQGRVRERALATIGSIAIASLALVWVVERAASL